MDVKQIGSLIAYATAARESAYAPYSKYQVGAAVMMGSGEIYTGCNVENASYGLCICAERTAIVKAVSTGERKIKAVAVATAGGGSPCGACRQFISEFADDETVIIIHDVTEEQPEQLFKMPELLPSAFKF